MTTTGDNFHSAGDLFRNSLDRMVKPEFILARIPEGSAYEKPVPSDRCPECGDEIPEETETEGPVYWKVTDEPFCGMECVVKRHRKWLKEQRGIAGN